MKHLVIILSLVIGTAAHAEYKVGDSATYAVESQGNNFDLKYEVKAVDEAADSITVNESVIYNGSILTEKDEDGTISETEMNEKVFDACLQMPSNFNPRYETVSVTAGTFNTCHLTITDESGAETNAYFGKVVFGIVKMSKEGSSDGSDIALELKTFKKL